VAKVSLRRGFKAEAERIAIELRGELGLDAQRRLDPKVLAEHLHVPVLTLRDLAHIAREDVEYFLERGSSTFSAATIHVGRFKRVIVTNPAHATTRQMNSLCHELSHIVLDHEAEAPSSSGGRSWNGVQEREADWLAGCLLIPRDAARAAARRGHTDEDVARRFGVSRALATWRMRMTGARSVRSEG
jgi:Zn-dependent peptidase ImmA (M78 family)